VSPSRDPAKTPKGDESREKIVRAALALFGEQGYEATTMRAIAERAGVSLGNAYYYFPSKEHLLQAFYAATHGEHVLRSKPVLERERTLEARLKGVLLARLEADEPYHRSAGAVFQTAADPESPLNPFSDASAPVRNASIALFQEVVSGARLRLPKDLAPRLPQLLWMFQMSVILFWIHDRSPRRERTRRLIDHGVGLVVKLVSLASNPLLAPLRKRAIRMLDDVRL
jgi:AcrR family transcriptional regulator